MQKRMSGVLLVVFLAVSSGTFAQLQGTGMLFLRQPDSPTVLVETTHNVKDLLESAKLKNQSSQRVTGYRIGWVAVYPTGREKVALGLPVELPLGISPGATINVPAQGVSMDYPKEGALAVVFFVTDVRTSGQNGTTESSVWRLSLEKFEEQALALTKSAINSPK
jgi:hypothetical protein